MYNTEIKKRYIVEKESTTNVPGGYLSKLFIKTSTYEIRLQKDISCFTVHEIIDFYKTLNIASPSSLVVINSHLNLYTDWCLKQNIVQDYQNHFYEINHDMLQACINTVALDRSVLSREELYKLLDELLNPSDAFIMLALFEGIRGETFCELVNLKMSDFNGNTVKLCTGRELTISDKLVELAEKSNKTTDYYAVKGASSKMFSFLDENLIVKNMYNCMSGTDTFNKGQRIYRRLLRNFEYLGISKWMKASSLENSGIIDYINTRCKELKITAKEFLYSDYVKEVDYKYDTNLKANKALFYRKYEKYLV